ncbi:unnamed protein product [Peronospora effusa]|nr:unnamed protein product [Peronospora effusa]
MEISYIPGCRMSITQHGYIEKILTRFKMTNCKPVPTPQVQGNFLMPENPDVEPVCVDPDPEMDYRQIVGSLQYLVQRTRPDIANAKRMLGKFLNCYTREHYVLVKRVFRYLRRSSDYGLLWTLSDKTRVPKDVYVNASRPTIDVQIVAYADADFGNERDDRRSLTGYVLQMEGSECSTMIMWTHNLCEELGVSRKRTILYEDIKVIKANTGDYKVKSVDLKYHKIRDYVENDEFALVYCPSEDMVADILTKPLGPTQSKKLRHMLNIVPVPTTTTPQDIRDNEVLGRIVTVDS